MDLYPPQQNYPLCTIANTPRLPEHCIEYARIVLWERDQPFGDIPVDGDNPDHITWIYKTAVDRAQLYEIQGYTYSLTLTLFDIDILNCMFYVSVKIHRLMMDKTQ